MSPCAQYAYRNGITWTNVAALNYDWEVRSSGAPGVRPAGLEDSGNNVLSAPVNLTGLPSATVFAAYVRSNCTGPLTSNWSSAFAPETPQCGQYLPGLRGFRERNTLCPFDLRSRTRLYSDRAGSRPVGERPY